MKIMGSNIELFWIIQDVLLFSLNQLFEYLVYFYIRIQIIDA